VTPAASEAGVEFYALSAVPERAIRAIVESTSNVQCLVKPRSVTGGGAILVLSFGGRMLHRFACLLALTAIATSVSAQSATPSPHVWKLVWQDITNKDGVTARVPVFTYQERRGDHELIRAPTEITAVVHINERFRVACSGHSAEQLAQLVSADYCGTDADGHRIDRQGLLDALVSSTTQAVDDRQLELRLAAGAVIVSGQKEITSTAERQRIQFTRVYSRDPQDQEWRLITSTEIRAR
jgi:hypothetical protein